VKSAGQTRKIPSLPLGSSLERQRFAEQITKEIQPVLIESFRPPLAHRAENYSRWQLRYSAQAARTHGVNVLPLDFLPLDAEHVSDVNLNLYRSRILRMGRSPSIFLLFRS